MSKKFFDIIPPKRKGTEKKEFSERDFFRSDNKANYSLEKKRGKAFLGKSAKIFLITFVLIIFLVFLINNFFSRAEIEIKPEIEEFNYNDSNKTIVDFTDKKLDLSLKTIPGKVLQVEKTISEEFNATGSFMKKAEGVIRLYNKFTTRAEVWRAGTRFVSSEGKLFLAKEKINVPGATLKGNKIVPSFVDVPVVAIEGGKDYNIKPSKFSIVAFLGTEKYTNYYGESLKPMEGGGVLSQVTEEDLKKASEILSIKVRDELNLLLKKEAGDNFIFLPQITKLSILKETSSANNQEFVDKFTYTISATATNVVFSVEDINNLAFNLLEKEIPENYDFRKEGLKIDYKKYSFDLQSGKMNFNILISASIYPKIDLNSLKKSLAGKSLNLSKIFLKQENSILKSTIRVFPFWIRKIPEDVEKINIKLVFD